MSEPITFNPFDAVKDLDAEVGGKTQKYIHIRIQQRNGRKTLTTVQGIPTEFDLKRLLKAFKKEFSTNGTIVEDEDLGEVIQVQGDKRGPIRDFLVDQEIATMNDIKVHGF